jgi:ferredoxin
MEKPKALVDKYKCLACGGCISICPKDAIIMIVNKAAVNKKECISCEICINACPIGAITWEVIK